MATITPERPRADSERDARGLPAFVLAIPLDVRLKVDADGFAGLCAANPDLRLERDADGGLLVMTPVSSDGGARELEFGAQLAVWNKLARLGTAFGPSSGFTFPDGSIRAPDASWIRNEVWNAVDRRERRKFARVVPDFVAEIRSPSDSPDDLRAKMAAYVAHGVRLGWLIDPETKTVVVYRPGREPEVLSAPKTLAGEDVLPGFVLELAEILED